MDVRQHAFLARQPSAELKTREHFWGMPKRGLAFLLANVMFWQPMWAQADGIVVANPGTSLGQAGNGVPIVNIATPNGSGLSHNQFHDYNVGTQGVILNNVAAQTGATQLGAIIVGNPNLTNRVAAQTILNEVVGGSPSQLRGYTEVAGQSARVIVANPYGISCNGCGFINTPRVTLTTGKPVLDNGRLDRFQVDQGSVSIDGDGLNASNVDHFEIITRSAKINAQIQANNLTIIAGRNDVNADTLNATARANDGSAKPELAIDSSALGGMYAGTIKLVGTEAGVGVRLAGNVAASGGDIQLDVNGHLSLAQTAASGAVNVNAASLDVSGRVYAGSSLAINTRGDLNVQQSLAARDRISLSSGGQLSNQAVIEAGVNSDNSRNATGDVSLSAQNLSNTGSIIASRAVQATVAQTLFNQGGTLSAQQSANITAATLDNQNKGRVLSSGSLGVSATQLLNAQGGLFHSAGSLTTQAGYVNNNGGEVSSLNTATLNIASLDNVAGLVSAGMALSLTASGKVNNQGGKLTGLDTLNLSAGQVDNSNQGRIASNQTLTASVSGLDQHNGGQLTSSSALTLDLNHGQLNNQNGLINAPLLMLKNLQGVVNQNGEISSAQAFTLAADSFDNSNGKLLSNQALTLRINQALSNVNGLISAATLDAHSASVDNSNGLISSHGVLSAGADGSFVNQGGTVIADGDMQLNAGTLNNLNGQVSGKRDLKAQITSLTNQNGKLIALGALTLSGSTLDNRGKGLVGATQALNVKVDAIDNRGGELSSTVGVALLGSQLDNSDSGQVIAGDTLKLTVDHVINQSKGLLSATGDLSLTGSSLDVSGGSLVSQHNLNVGLTGSLTNSAGLLSSEGLLTINAASLANRLGSLSSAGQLSLTSAGLIDNQGGKLVTDGGIDVHSASLDNSQAGSVSGKGAVSITTGILDNSHAGNLNSSSTLNLNAGQVTNQDNGRIASVDTLTASVTGLDQQGGQLFSNTGLNLDLNNGQLNNQNGLINAPILVLKNLNGVANQNGEISSPQAFTLTANNLDNSNAKLLSSQALTLQINQALSNIKGLIAAASIDTHVGSLDNSGGTLTSRADLNLHVDGQLGNQNLGLINAATLLNISSAGLNNQNGSLLGSAISLDFTGTSGDLNNGAGLITTAGQLTVNHLRDLNNQGGEISSNQSFSLVGRTLDNSGGKLISSNLLSLNASASLLNQNGLVSGWQGLDVSAASLDNRNNGTLSSRNGDLSANVSGALLNSGAGALVSQNALTVNAASLDNSGGILSSGAGQTLTVGGLLNNGQKGLIDSGAALIVQAMTLGNAAGAITAQKNLSFTGTALDNTSGSLVGNETVTLDLLGALTNTNGKLASAGPLLIQRASQIDNQGGQLASQSLMTLFTGGLDNSNRGTVAASGQLLLSATGAVQNNADGLIYSQNAGLQLQAASLANSKGTMQSQGALALTVSGDIDNQSGRIIAQGADLTVNAGNLDSRGGVLASLQGAFTAHLAGVLKNGYDLTNNNQGGVIQAHNLDITALAGINNYGGRISAQTGDALIHTADFDNRNGGLYATGRVNVTGNNFDNSGSNDGQIAGSQIDLTLSGVLNNRLGIIESDSTLAITAASIDNQTGQLRALGTSGKTNFQIGGLFDNSNGTIETANTDLTLGAGSFHNTGGSLLHAGTGTFDISTANVMGAGGTLVTRGGLTLNANSWTNSSVIQAGRLTVNVNSLSQTASGQLLASDSFSGSGGSWYNDGLIASDGNLSLGIGGAYWGAGRLSSQGNLGLSAAQVSLNSVTSTIASGGDATINVSGQLDNAGRLTSMAAMTVTAGGLRNYGTLGAGGNLTVNTGALLNNNGLISSGGNMQLLASSFTNSYAQVYGFGNVLIGRDSQGGMANLLDNRSGNIDSAQNLTINAMTVNNVMDVLQYTDHTKSSATITQLTCAQIPIAGCDERDWGGINGRWEIDETDSLRVTSSSAASGLTSGANLLINAQTLNNISSTIAASGNLTANATTINNNGLQPQDITTVRTYWNFVTQINQAIAAAADFNAKNSPTPSATVEADLSAFINWMGGGLLTQTSNVTNTSGQSYGAVIQAGGSVNLNAAQNINNSVVRAYYAFVTAGHTNTDTRAGSTYATRVQINAQLPPNLAQQQVNPTALPGFSLPTGQNGLFRLSAASTSAPVSTGPQSWTLGGGGISAAQRQQSLPASQLAIQVGGIAQASASSVAGLPGVTAAPGPLSIARVQGLPSSASPSNPQKYLIETNPVLTDLKQFMSSDYLLKALGYNPDDSAKRLGDGFYEQKLIQQAVVAGTGQAFINGKTSNEAQFKYLMDNAIASKNELKLSVGVSLTAEQVAALTHDIVWMESEVVDGQTVLVPVLYLANANNRLAANGALIQGGDVSLIAGQNLDNAGTLRASNNLSAAAGNNLVNSGLVEAGNRLDLLAGNNIANQSGGIIAGRDVSLTAVNGDVTNELTVTSHKSSVDEYSQQTDVVDSAARIEAANNLTIRAGRDLNNTGGVLKSAANTTITAGRDVKLSAVQQVVSHDYGADRRDQSITQHGSSVTAGQDLSIQAGRDLLAIASQIDAKRDVAMAAGGNLTLASAADETHSYYQDNKVKAQEDHVSQVSTTVNAGGNVTLNASQDLTLSSSNVTAGNEAYLVAGGQLNVLAAQNSDYSLYDMKKKGSWGSKKTQRDEVTDVKNIGSEIKTGGDLTLISGGDQRYQGAKLNSGGDLTLDSGGSITFEAVKDSHQESHEKSDTSLAWMSMSGKGSTDETLRQSVLAAQGNVAINAVNGLHIDLKQVNQQTVSQAIDAMVAADPQMAWLKDAEQRGDVNWQLIQEVHDSYEYSHSGLGQGAMLAIIIIVTILTAGSGTAAALASSASAAAQTAALAAGMSAATAATIGAAAAAAATASFSAALS
ncbi:filamentous hemagglutinin N-terminal domain-containing protein [Pseudomonas sp. DC1.2]|uniref:two-partner secretion domain-containing protein n=2 Tax=unclassified Pseudomonas TaxID=196821 RepID=UPI002B223E74|nr:filamentous hemagglutinin N-terminal domain-containing protein [Pseudomonas sp. DC1.2]